MIYGRSISLRLSSVEITGWSYRISYKKSEKFNAINIFFTLKIINNVKYQLFQQLILYFHLKFLKDLSYFLINFSC